MLIDNSGRKPLRLSRSYTVDAYPLKIEVARLRSEQVKAKMSQEPSNHVFMDQHGKHM